MRNLLDTLSKQIQFLSEGFIDNLACLYQALKPIDNAFDDLSVYFGLIEH